MSFLDIRHVCDAREDLDVDRALHYLRLFQRVLGVDVLYLGHESIDLTKGWLEDRVAAYIDRVESRSARIRQGVLVSLSNSPGSVYEFGVFVRFGMRPRPGAAAEANGFTVPAAYVRDRPERVAELDTLLEEGVEILDPFYAAIEDSVNCRRMAAFELSRKVPAEGRPGAKEEPVLVHWKTYFGPELIDAFGGTAIFEAVGVSQARRLGEGVVLELVGGLFDDSNDSHRAKQIEIMDVLGIQRS